MQSEKGNCRRYQEQHSVGQAAGNRAEWCALPDWEEALKANPHLYRGFPSSIHALISGAVVRHLLSLLLSSGDACSLPQCTVLPGCSSFAFFGAAPRNCPLPFSSCFILSCFISLEGNTDYTDPARGMGCASSEGWPFAAEWLWEVKSDVHVTATLGNEQNSLCEKLHVGKRFFLSAL